MSDPIDVDLDPTVEGSASPARAARAGDSPARAQSDGDSGPVDGGSPARALPSDYAAFMAELDRRRGRKPKGDAGDGDIIDAEVVGAGAGGSDGPGDGGASPPGSPAQGREAEPDHLPVPATPNELGAPVEPEYPPSKATLRALRKGLKIRHRKFAEAYCGSCACNGTQAALKAGYPKSWAHVAASELLQQPKIRAYIDALLDIESVKQEEIIARMGQIVRGRYSDICDENGVPSLQAAIAKGTDFLIKEIVPTKNGLNFKLHDPLAAAQLIAKIKGMLQEKLKLEVQDIRDLDDAALEEIVKAKYKGG